MSWLDLVERSEGLRIVFGGVVPHLDDVRLLSVTLDQNGPTAILRFDLAEYPADPPIKWKKEGHNTVQVELSVSGLLETKISGWALDNVSSLKIEPCPPSGVKVEFVTGDAALLFVAQFALVQKISGYHDTTRSCPEAGEEE